MTLFIALTVIWYNPNIPVDHKIGLTSLSIALWVAHIWYHGEAWRSTRKLT